MKKIVICLLLTIASSTGYSQINVDSLKHITISKDIPSDDILNAYYALCNFYTYSSSDSLYKYAQRGLKFAQENEHVKEFSAFYNAIGKSYAQKNNHDSAYYFFNQAIDLAVKYDSKGKEANVYYDIADMEARRGNHTVQLENLIKAASIYEQIDQKNNYINALSSIGSVYNVVGNKEKAFEYLLKSRKLSEEINYMPGLLKSYFELGILYLQTNEDEKALAHAKKALEISREMNFKAFEIGSLQLAGNIYFAPSPSPTRDLDKALFYGEEAHRVAKEINDPYLIYSTLTSLSATYRELERYKDCLSLSLKGWEMDSTSMNEAPTLASNIILSYFAIGEKKKGLDFFWRYNNLKNEYASKSLHDSMAEMEIKYETEKKELRIASLEKEKQFYSWLGVLGIIILTLGGGLFFYRSRMNKHKLAQLEQEKQLVATQALLDGETAERTRLARDLHDGLGGLLSVLKLNLTGIKVSTLSEEDGVYYNKAANILEESNSELRRIAHHMMPESLMKTGLKTSLSDFSHSIPGVSFTFQGNDTRLDDRLEVTLYRIAYELINNALKYANASKIDVELLLDNHLVSLSVHDDGIGFDPTAIQGGTGLKNIKKRLSPFNGKVHIYSTPNEGTEVTIEIEQS